MNRLNKLIAVLAISFVTFSCTSFNAYQKARAAELQKDWDQAVIYYEQAVAVDRKNNEYRMALMRAKREASREHFEKGKTLKAEADQSRGADQLRLANLAATELQMTVKLDPTNQYAVVELDKTVTLLNNLQKAADERVTIDEIKKRAQASQIGKAQPPQLNPASNEPITLTFSRDTPVKDIYRALGNAFGINILYDQAVKDDRITIDLRDVTAQQALERVMQAANHFYKVLDEKTIIIVPDNPQARRDYEDLVIQTFYLSNGDAEQVTNVVRTMTEARNIFPLKALNAITIRDTADKIRIAEKIIQANDKAKAEVVVSVELLQIDLSKIRDMGMAISGFPDATGAISPSARIIPQNTLPGATGAFTGGTLENIAKVLGSANDLRRSLNFTIPAATYSLLKTLGNSELLAHPELRISEGEKATLHIGQRIPVPVTTVAQFTGLPNTGQPNQQINPYGTTSFQYQDVGIKVAMEPRVHHNREVTLKLSVEVSNLGQPVSFAGQSQPTFATRTIESTIRLQDGETNFLAGLIQNSKTEGEEKTPFLGDVPLIGRLFTKERREENRTDLVLTMTPHIVRIPDITEEDVAPMWVGTGANLTFRGVSPRIESQGAVADPFVPARGAAAFNSSNDPDADPEGFKGDPNNPPGTMPPPSRDIDPEGSEPQQMDPEAQRPPAPRPPADSASRRGNAPAAQSSEKKLTAATAAAKVAEEPTEGMLRLAPRLSPQPGTITLGPGESKIWNVVGMDLDGLTAPELVLNFNPRAMDVTDVVAGSALFVDPAQPPVVTVDRTSGTIRIKSSNSEPLKFVSGGVVLAIRVHGGLSGETFLVLNNPDFHDGGGHKIAAAVTGGRAKVQ
jgi:general secretion pathway protein D